MRSYRGFTLAEVLITLGIIGIVAAMTIPTLIANTNSRRFASQFKKTISTLKQAALLAEGRYNINLGSLNATCINGATDTIEDGTICGLFNATLAGATFISPETVARNREIYGGLEGPCQMSPHIIGYMLADGSTFYFEQQTGNCVKESKCKAFIDVNGYRLPNKEVSGVEVTMYQNLITPAAYAEESREEENIYVPVDSQHMTDIYQIYIYDQEVVPATAAGRYVLTGTTSRTGAERQ